MSTTSATELLAAGVHATVEDLEKRAISFDPGDHPRYPKGHPQAGKFMPSGGGGSGRSHSSRRPSATSDHAPVGDMFAALRAFGDEAAGKKDTGQKAGRSGKLRRYEVKGEAGGPGTRGDHSTASAPGGKQPPTPGELREAGIVDAYVEEEQILSTTKAGDAYEVVISSGPTATYSVNVKWNDEAKLWEDVGGAGYEFGASAKLRRRRFS